MADSSLPPVYLEFKGDTRGLDSAMKTAVGSLKGFQNQAENTGKAAHSMGITSIAAGTAMGYMFVGLAHKIKDFGSEFFNEFKNLAGETKKLQRSMGGTAEEISGLIFAAEKFGVTTDGLSAGIQVLSRHVVANDKAAKDLGFSYRDSNKHMLPTIDILKGIADKYAAMPAGLERNAYLTKELGRGAGQLAPLFALGSKGIEELTAEAKKMGIQISGDDLTSLKKYTEAQKTLNETVQSLKVSIGRQLLPVFTQQLVYLGAGIKTISEWAKAHKDGLMQAAKAALIFAVAITAVQGVSSTAQTVIDGFNGVLAAGQAIWVAVSSSAFLYALAIAAVVAAVVWAMKKFEIFHDAVFTILQGMGTAVGVWARFMIQTFTMVPRIILNVVGTILSAAGKLAPILNAAGVHWADGLEKMSGTLMNIKTNINDFANTMPSLGKKIGKGIASGLEAAGNTDIKGAINKISAMFQSNVAGSNLQSMLDSVNSSLGGADKKTGGGGSKAKSAAKVAGITAAQLISNVKQYWDAVVNAAQTARDIARTNYEKARDLMKSAYSGLSTATGGELDVTKFIPDKGVALSSSGIVQYFREKLTNIKDFVANLNVLKDAGLNPTILAQLVAAGPVDGAAAAKVLAGDTSAIAELNAAQAEFVGVAAGASNLFGADTTVEDYMMGTPLGGAYTSAESNYGQAVAGQTAANAAADVANQTNNISIVINAADYADPAAISQDIANAVAAGVKQAAHKKKKKR